MNTTSKKNQLITLFQGYEQAETINEQGQPLVITYFRNNKYCLAAWMNTRQQKPTFHFAFRSELERQEYIAEIYRIADQQSQRDRQAETEAKQKAEQYKAGQILYCSWGYEQTNIDFYVILERKNSRVIIQEIGQTRVNGENHDTGTCLPDPQTRLGQPFTKVINKYGNIRLSSYQTLMIHDGRPMSWSSWH